MIFFNKKKEAPAPAQKELSAEDRYARLEKEKVERKEAGKRFVKENGPKIDRFLEEYPHIEMWSGYSFDRILLTWSEKGRPFFQEGRFILSEDGELLRWEGETFSLEKVSPTLSEEMRVAQLALLLKDSPDLSRYCEQAAITLLEDGSAVFNAPVGMKIKPEEYEKRYSSPEWESAWINALKGEFQAKEVVSTEKLGCFRMEAL